MEHSSQALIANALSPNRPTLVGPARAIVVDYLNVLIASDGRLANMNDMCMALSFSNPISPIIIVTKVMRMCDDDYVAITETWPNVAIIVCGDDPHVSGRSHEHMADEPPDLLAEADDNMIAMLAIAVTMMGCAPEIMSGDKYRNCKAVFDGIPEYSYTVYHAGTEATGLVANGKKWITCLLANLVGLGRGLGHCPGFKSGQCSLCQTEGISICPYCGVCVKCRYFSLPDRLAGLLDKPS